MFTLFACAEPEPAPRDLDTVAHDLWVHYAAEDEPALIADVQDLRGLLDEDALPMEGIFTDLTAEEAAPAGFSGDPSIATGMFVATHIGCTPDEIEAIVKSQDQMALYPENYLSYVRNYTSDESAFTSGAANHLSWEGTYEVEIPIIGTYISSILGGMHRADDGADGPYYYSTTVMPSPAETTPDTLTFDVDLQLEVFYPHDDGMVHLFGMWRHIVSGELDTDGSGMQALIIDGLIGWDGDTTAICEEGRI